MKTGRIVSLTSLVIFVLIAIIFFYAIHIYSSAIKNIKIDATEEIPKYGDISVENGGNKIIEEMVIKFLDKEYIVMGLPGDGSEYKQHIDTHMEGKFNINVKIKYKDNTKIEKDLAVRIPSSYPHLALHVTDDGVKVSDRAIRDPNSPDIESSGYGRMQPPPNGEKRGHAIKNEN